MQIRYVNHLGTEIDLTAAPYMALGGDILDYDWALTTVARSDGRGGRVASFSREVTTKALPVQIWAHDESEYAAAVDALHNALEVDVDALTPGTLYVGNAYVKAYASASQKSEWDDGAPFMLNAITFAIESARWISETTYDFYKYDNTSASGFKYQACYPAKYCATGGIKTLTNTHYSDTPAIFTIYGPANNPAIRINDSVYTVHSSIEESERIVINQLDMTVYKVGVDGTITSLFSHRGKTPSVFEPVPSGEIKVYFSSVFAFQVKLLAQRSEPKWA